MTEPQPLHMTLADELERQQDLEHTEWRILTDIDGLIEAGEYQRVKRILCEIGEKLLPEKAA